MDVNGLAVNHLVNIRIIVSSPKIRQGPVFSCVFHPIGATPRTQNDSNQPRNAYLTTCQKIHAR